MAARLWLRPLAIQRTPSLTNRIKLPPPPPHTLYRMLKSAHTKFLSGFAESFRVPEFESLQLGFCLKCSGFLSATLSRPPAHRGGVAGRVYIYTYIYIYI